MRLITKYEALALPILQAGYQVVVVKEGQEPCDPEKIEDPKCSTTWGCSHCPSRKPL